MRLAVREAPETADGAIDNVAREPLLPALPGDVIRFVERTIISPPFLEEGPVKPGFDILPFIGL